MWHMDGMGAGWWVLMGLGWLAIWGFIAWAIVSVARDSGRPRGEDRTPTAREVLDRRLAAGEITIEEYERLRDALRDVHTV